MGPESLLYINLCHPGGFDRLLAPDQDHCPYVPPSRYTLRGAHSPEELGLEDAPILRVAPAAVW
ncbi:hypothetical protein FKM82_025118 [Ascaphus truei]